MLPYRFGTHSGWLEACFDLGTAVIAPSCGFYGQQRQCEVFDYTETTFDADSLDRAVRVVHRPIPGRHSAATGDLGATARRTNRTVDMRMLRCMSEPCREDEVAHRPDRPQPLPDP